MSSFGPLLLGKVLSLNETQTSVLTMVFKYCDDGQLPLLDLPDLRAVLQYLSSDEGKPALANYGGMSSATVGVLLRKMIELESQGADQFFGEPEFDVKDLLHVTSDGRGVVTCLELSRRAGQAAPVVDLHDVDAGRAVSQPARGRRPAQAQAGLLLRRGAPALRRRLEGISRRRCSRWCGSSGRRASASTS